MGWVHAVHSPDAKEDQRDHQGPFRARRRAAWHEAERSKDPDHPRVGAVAANAIHRRRKRDRTGNPEILFRTSGHEIDAPGFSIQGTRQVAHHQ